MSYRARVDLDVVFHDYSDSSLSVGTASEHLYVTPGGAVAVSGTVGTSAISVVGPTSCSTFCVKNTGSTVLRLGGAISVPAGRLAVVPTTATISAVGGNGSYSCIWVG